MHIREIRKYCQLQDEGQSLMRAANNSFAVIGACLCTAQCHRILKLARTIADLAGSDEIQSAHLAEALQFRPKIMM
jgi:magnesium chelatase family protein